MPPQQPRSLLDAIQEGGNHITCVASTADGGVMIIGTINGSLVAVATTDGSPNAFSVLSAQAAHASAVRGVAISEVGWLVACGGDDATIVVQPLAPLLRGSGKNAVHTPSDLVTQNATSHTTTPASSSAALLDGAAAASELFTRVRCHTLPITHVAWSPSGVQVLTSAYDGYVAVYCTAARCVVNRVCVGFPITTFAFSGTDVSCLFVAGRCVARVDLAEGSRIALPQATMRFSAKQPVAPRATSASTTQTTSGVVRMEWCSGEGTDEANVCSDLALEPAWGGDGVYVHHIAYDTVTHAVRAYLPIGDNGGKAVNGASAAYRVLEWRMRRSQWMLATGPYTTAPTHDADLLQTHWRTTLAAQRSEAEVPNVDHRHNPTSAVAVPVSSWSLGYSTWFKPKVAVRELDVVCTVAASDAAEDVLVIPMPAKKKRRAETVADPLVHQLNEATLKMQAAQESCDALAATLRTMVHRKS